MECQEKGVAEQNKGFIYFDLGELIWLEALKHSSRALVLQSQRNFGEYMLTTAVS